jgi:dimethylargininase
LKALVRRPSPRVAEGIVTHIERRPVDAALALRQWEGYVEALRQAGWEPIELPRADDCPDGVFVEDVVVAYDGVAVVTRPGAAERRAELAGLEDVLAGLGLDVARIEAPATLDGGDVLNVGTTVYVGLTGRTNAGGVERLRAILEPRGADVVAVPVGRVLHLKSAVTALPDGSIVGWPPFIDEPSLLPRLVEVPEEAGSHVVLLGGAKLLVAADCPRSAELFASLGYEPIVVDIGEFEKLEGCVTCLSVLLPG